MSTGIRTEGVPLTDGSELRLTVGEPDGPARGGVVVLQEARGVTDSVRLLVTGLAGDGWLAVAPHLYHRDDADDLGAGSDTEVAEQLGRLEPQQVMDDCETAFGWLADNGIEPDRMGVLGFDIGGTVALHVAANRTLGAAVTVAGEGVERSPSHSVPALVETAPELTCPWLGIYSEAADSAAVARLREAAESSGVATDLVVFPSTGYRFDDDPESAAEAWERVLNWYDAHLR
ncbi:Carboxymethylenebutenolidase [Pseudonocardia sp. Ae168_Ps1]|uniref:dienelactone hydrolase family protein n=1 Tax=unclassified Pseudonocardia TaxID=2619320 RepID=UPI0001FFE4F0|nr:MULTISPECIES: dienelactone hydrolase family protein [unclassified Pseudonocardia]ALE71956.1 carboxymethylenebutenolidase [Pseudonocardia sp. EC080625-04]ALE75397.1 carboxymethylenebutenolidase [Pseudonocardia sp. EC080625-04]ALL74763.1 carboxymethylenebutenolidase [Pseudonocardia sp. EC080610-09]ALL81786.1 carboxymethylenebutenolidase [Pseudonocardia sp. EC080619-01]ALL85821.1 carboxymethylenebutenolidase [Pseudonocardia sp. EC080619-01]